MGKKHSLLTYIQIFTFLFSSILFSSGNPKPAFPSSSEILQSLHKLNVLGSVLYIAAHPDDENTSVISYMIDGKLVRTAYMSLTRGDGGQNLLGDEKGDLLGVIRSQELLAARRTDGGEQFFSRAIDFGYSKTPEETLTKWNKEKVLYDIVKVIREFKPDIILTRFSKTHGGHGHHLASAILAEEAFHKAADPSVFPDQLKKLTTWQAKRILWDSWHPDENAISIDVGKYNPVLGKSYTEIAAFSRSFHKSQGFGVSPSIGSRLADFNFTSGEPAKDNLFEGIDITWNRVPNSGQIRDQVNILIKSFNPLEPETSISNLVVLYKLLNKHKPGYWITQKIDEVKNLILMCSGMHIESSSNIHSALKGEKVYIKTTLVNRSKHKVTLKNVSTTFGTSDSSYNYPLVYNQPKSVTQENIIPSNMEYTQPYWLKNQNNGNMFNVNELELIGKAEDDPIITSSVVVEIDDTEIVYSLPVKYRWNDSVDGQKERALVVVPKLSLQIENNNYIFADKKPKSINVSIVSQVDSITGYLQLNHPSGWIVSPNKIDFSLVDSGDKKTFSFLLTPTSNAADGEITLEAISNGKKFNRRIVEINYPHIPIQTLLEASKAKVLNLDIKIVDKNIGYIMGSGDEIPEALTQLGYSVELLSDEDLDSKDLSQFDVIICGVRAFNTRKHLEHQQKRILKFVENGGTWIVQHNTRFGFRAEQIGPYPYTANGRARITEEDANIEILKPDHQIFSYPNKITQKDFKNWTMERGTYLAEEWDNEFTPLLSGHDTGESAKQGALLYSNYGKGIFIFTAMSWFRQLPAGVPGAYRLFVNVISAKEKE